MFVCISVRLRISKTTRPNFTKFSIGLHVNCGRGSVVSDDNAISYVLPVLWTIWSVAQTACLKVTHQGERHRGRSVMPAISLLHVSNRQHSAQQTPPAQCRYRRRAGALTLTLTLTLIFQILMNPFLVNNRPIPPNFMIVHLHFYNPANKQTNRQTDKPTDVGQNITPPTRRRLVICQKVW